MSKNPISKIYAPGALIGVVKRCSLTPGSGDINFLVFLYSIFKLLSPCLHAFSLKFVPTLRVNKSLENEFEEQKYILLERKSKGGLSKSTQKSLPIVVLEIRSYLQN